MSAVLLVQSVTSMPNARTSLDHICAHANLGSLEMEKLAPVRKKAALGNWHSLTLRIERVVFSPPFAHFYHQPFKRISS